MQVIKYQGVKIDRPGIYIDLPIETYHGDCCEGPSVSKSGLHKIWTHSLAKYWDTCPYNPDAEDDADETSKRHFVLGRATHHLLLGQEKFLAKFVVRPEEWAGYRWNGNRLEHKKWLADRAAEGREVITMDEAERIVKMRKTLLNEPLIKHGILNGFIEHSFLWKDRETGLWFKGRPDAIPGDSDDLADLKITRSVKDEDLQRSIYEHGYLMQAAMITLGYRELMKRNVTGFHLVFVEHTRPYCVVIVTLKPEEIELGIQMVHSMAAKLAHAFRTSEWPGPAGLKADARYLGITDWARKDIEYRLSLTPQQRAA